MIIILAALLSGCGGPLQYAYAPSTPETPGESAEEGTSIYISPLQDNRKDVTDTHKIGELHATVLDISGTKLLLTKEPAVVVREALVWEFTRKGFKVRGDASKENSDYILKAGLEKFHLDIASKDTIDIALKIEVINLSTNTTAWSGVAEVSDSIYAGVSGNSRRTISRYITASLEKVIQNTLNQTEEAIKKDFSAHTQTQPFSGQITKADKRGPEENASTGVLGISTLPTRAKIYLNHIYYGLSPQRLHLKPGIYNLIIKKDGFLDYSEKVAVDRERETEVVERLRKSPLR